MAGKHVATYVTGTDEAAWLAAPPLFPGTPKDRAYAEGRRAQESGGIAGDNPHTFGTDVWQAWANGFLTLSVPGSYPGDRKYQTAVNS